MVTACDGEIGAARDAWVAEHHLREISHGATLVGRMTIRYAAHRGSHGAH